ncbi:MAG: DUF1592 domain-containing protein [Verrucomicrobiota bacterium]|nr:DUF1592 domain-containing protein [Verrucomicrobiota bacterium]
MERCLVIAATLLTSLGVLASDPVSGAEASAFQEELAPFLGEYCHGCHGSEKQKAEIDFENMPIDTVIYKDRPFWELARDLISEGEMPPSKSQQPSPEERADVVHWINQELLRFDCSSGAKPGRVTIRRMNRAEYGNTIRDLTGLDFNPAEDFPLDEVGYGFDNIGDVLSLSPILMEKYLNAAESVVTNATLAEIPAWPPVFRYQAEQFSSPSEDEVRSEGSVMGFFREGFAWKTLNVAEAGEFRFLIRAYGQQAGPEHAKLEVKLGDQEKHTIRVDATDDEPKLYAINARLDAGPLRLSLAYLNNYNVQDHPVAELNGDRNLFVDFVEMHGPLNLEPPPLPVTHTRIIPGRPDAGSELVYAKTILGTFMKRAWRRPVAQNEVDRVVSLVEIALEKSMSFEASIQVALQAVLTSPHFLFRWELDPPHQDGKTDRQLNDYELASRLSYFLWSSMPDTELFSLADDGQLRNSKVLERQVERMVQDPKSDAFITNFAGQWLQFRSLDTVTPDPSRFPGFGQGLREAMQRESELFFGEIMRGNRGLTDFLEADFTYANEILAGHYGIEGIQGRAFQRVQLPVDSQRGGILTQGSVLTLTSNPTRTSPVLRGKWILEQILGTPPPPPPPDVPLLPENDDSVLSGSLRERLEKHRLKPECANCHDKMDPIGFAFENFNAVGAWRDLDEGFAIDPSGTLPDGTKFNGPKELIKELMNQNTFVYSLIEKMLTYALGRGLEYYDKCAVDEIYVHLREDHLRFQTLLKAIVLSKPFQLRQLEGNDL